MLTPESKSYKIGYERTKDVEEIVNGELETRHTLSG